MLCPYFLYYEFNSKNTFSILADLYCINCNLLYCNQLHSIILNNFVSMYMIPLLNSFVLKNYGKKKKSRLARQLFFTDNIHY